MTLMQAFVCIVCLLVLQRCKRIWAVELIVCDNWGSCDWCSNASWRLSTESSTFQLCRAAGWIFRLHFQQVLSRLPWAPYRAAFRWMVISLTVLKSYLYGERCQKSAQGEHVHKHPSRIKEQFTCKYFPCVFMYYLFPQWNLPLLLLLTLLFNRLRFFFFFPSGI